MKYLIKIADYYWKPGSSKEIIYKDDKGREFLGSTYNVVIGDTMIVEVGEALEEGYYKIIKFIGLKKG